MSYVIASRASICMRGSSVVTTTRCYFTRNT